MTDSQKPEVQKHIRCAPGEVARSVLLPGDPARARRIAEELDEASLIAENREYVVFSGRTKGVPVSVCSTGIGGASAAIALEELRNIGAEVFIRVGSAGGRRKDIPIGSLVVVTAAYRGDGVSDEYLPLGFPAVADLDVNNALIGAAKELGYSAWTGIGTTRSAFYARDPELNERLRQVGVVAAEMEASTLFIVGARRGAKVGCVVATDSNIYLDEQPSLAEKEALYMQGEEKTIRTALRAVQLLEAAS
ncbi:MAG: nucleoside phosphorylase [Chloroflexota bacterium]|nr:nucleoside phosphorylase [Chloroflexota bacterium]MDE2908247.1 nucleoside phosphorylase [Chloroflexota bacterium]